MTKVMPTAMTPVNDACLTMLRDILGAEEVPALRAEEDEDGDEDDGRGVPQQEVGQSRARRFGSCGLRPARGRLHAGSAPCRRRRDRRQPTISPRLMTRMRSHMAISSSSLRRYEQDTATVGGEPIDDRVDLDTWRRRRRHASARPGGRSRAGSSATWPAPPSAGCRRRGYWPAGAIEAGLDAAARRPTLRASERSRAGSIEPGAASRRRPETRRASCCRRSPSS